MKGHLGRQGVVWTAAKSRRQATAFLVRTMSWIDKVLATAPPRVLARSIVVAAAEVVSSSFGHAIRAATIFLVGKVMFISSSFYAFKQQFGSI